MTETKFTPGPWKFAMGEICGPDDADGDDTVLAAVGRTYGLRSAVHSVVRKGPAYEANGRLMAAGPDIFETLARFVEREEKMRRLRPDAQLGSMSVGLLEAGRAALLKATGDSS